MIDLDKAAQAAEALGWTVKRVSANWIIAMHVGCHVECFVTGRVQVALSSLTDIAPLIAAWAALAAGGTDGQS